LWRASLIRKRALVLGFVDAPDRVSAEVAAVKAFNLDDEQLAGVELLALIMSLIISSRISAPPSFVG
jgi:hypothetical protein